ncbi:cupin domain-containing protein [Candidatus Soleaferrea massiliensis]|uniref:cupin domain-containing protein n=1 Tax=Candidatus Soleaferrea massiliensis TaxID=1470354 RepID=UPI00058D1535|nr:cupin domain-containing protein [Candidatus Soleaferrea massiliensis]
MEIIVRKPTADEREELESCPTWDCEPSVFDWSYNMQETGLILEGEVEVRYDGKSVKFGAGDLVVFPQGLSCVWDVKKYVKKHYKFG